MCSKTQSAGRPALTTWRGLQPVLGQRDHLAGVDLAHQLGADDVEARSVSEATT